MKVQFNLFYSELISDTCLSVKYNFIRCKNYSYYIHPKAASVV